MANGVVHAAYDPVTSTGAWRTRIGTAMRYYATRPGRDKEQQEREAREHGNRQVRGRWFVTSDGQRLPLAEAEDRFLAQVEARRQAAAERKTAREQELTERYGRRIRLPDPVQRVYRVVLSTKWAVLHDRDVHEILGRAFGGLAGAAVGSVAHAVKTEYDARQREARWEQERDTRRDEREAQREAEREQRRLDRETRAAAGRQSRADARFAEQFRGAGEPGTWMYVRHGNTEHPHIHAVAVTDARGLDVRDLERLRAHVTEREHVRELEQLREREQLQPAQSRPHERQRGADRGMER